MSVRLTRSAAICALLASSLLLSACGLKQEQKDALSQQQNGVLTAAGQYETPGSAGTPGLAGKTGSGQAAVGAPGTGGAVGGVPGLPGTPGTTGTAGVKGGAPGVAGAGSNGVGGASGPGGAAASAAGKCQSVAGDQSTGVTASTINIGIHAPQTGTGAPLPPSFADGAAVYWKTHKICGRTVNVDFQDDKYTPPTARQVCEPMSRRDFLLIGAAGTDQIQSCATDNAIAGPGVPYLSAGVTTNGLDNLPHYFAFSLTYAQQSALVLKNAVNQGYAKGHWAVITSRTDNFKDARESMVGVLTGAAGKAAGVTFDPSQDNIQVDATNDSNLQSRALQTGALLATRRYDVVYVDTSPGYFVYMSQGASKQGFMGQYTGPGVTMTEVTVAQLICNGNSTIKANFLAPFPGIDRATDEFKAATGGKYDDIYWSLWGLSQSLDQAFQASSNLTRAGFISSLKDTTLAGGTYAPSKFAGQHFGGTGAYSQTVNCTQIEPNQTQPGQWNTLGDMIS